MKPISLHSTHPLYYLKLESSSARSLTLVPEARWAARLALAANGRIPSQRGMFADFDIEQIAAAGPEHLLQHNQTRLPFISVISSATHPSSHHSAAPLNSPVDGFLYHPSLDKSLSTFKT